MRDHPWRTLVRELTDAGHESPYLDRLRQRLDVARGRTALEVELVQEMAASLGRAEDKLLVALLQLEVAGRALADARDPEARRSRADAFNRARDYALRRRLELVIQREAVGIRRNDVIDDLYPVPPRVALDA
jgi:hypothetical protein